MYSNHFSCRAKVEEEDFIDAYFETFTGLIDVEVFESLPYSDSLQLKREKETQTFGGNLADVKKPSFDTIFDVKRRCMIPSNDTYQVSNFSSCIRSFIFKANTIRSFLKQNVLCCSCTTFVKRTHLTALNYATLSLTVTLCLTQVRAQGEAVILPVDDDSKDLGDEDNISD